MLKIDRCYVQVSDTSHGCHHEQLDAIVDDGWPLIQCARCQKRWCAPAPTREKLIELETRSEEHALQRFERVTLDGETTPSTQAHEEIHVKNSELTECTDRTPPWFVGHWKDWHRGHGCYQDDGKNRSDAAVIEIEQHRKNAATGYLTDAELGFLRAATTSGNTLLVRALDELTARRAAAKAGPT